MSVKHHFELTSASLICLNARNISTSHSETIQKEIDRMLPSGIFTPVESSQTFLFVTAATKYGYSLFCVDNQKQNSVIHADYWLLHGVYKFLDRKRGS